jgi:hypothetical protein
VASMQTRSLLEESAYLIAQCDEGGRALTFLLDGAYLPQASLPPCGLPIDWFAIAW